MLDMGFEPEIKKILLDIRPDRQTGMTRQGFITTVVYMGLNVGKQGLMQVRKMVSRINLCGPHRLIRVNTIGIKLDFC
ncbi:hypothetical protein DPMN_082452 [Dreissena polymorpha]|uniref:Uncharacterized protein n=1 Tax=Dreissena polymorpha TaxID=45954 RepID=A0A9D4BGV2_DREPO|nr:hypothetical protein DPMN_082452 [Dreissena polymorpha]